MKDAPTLKGVVQAALEIARQRRETLAHLRAALERGDESEALRLAREICGATDNDPKSHRTYPRVN